MQENKYFYWYFVLCLRYFVLGISSQVFCLMSFVIGLCHMLCVMVIIFIVMYMLVLWGNFFVKIRKICPKWLFSILSLRWQQLPWQWILSFGGTKSHSGWMGARILLIHMSQCMYVRPAKPQTSLRIRSLIRAFAGRLSIQ